MEESVVPRDPGLAIIYDMLESEHGGSSTSQNWQMFGSGAPSFLDSHPKNTPVKTDESEKLSWSRNGGGAIPGRIGHQYEAH